MVKKNRFCKLLYHRKCKRRGVGGQKKSNFVNVVCERPLEGSWWYEIPCRGVNSQSIQNCVPTTCGSHSLKAMCWYSAITILLASWYNFSSVQLGYCWLNNLAILLCSLIHNVCITVKPWCSFALMSPVNKKKTMYFYILFRDTFYLTQWHLFPLQEQRYMMYRNVRALLVVYLVNLKFKDRFSIDTSADIHIAIHRYVY